MSAEKAPKVAIKTGGQFWRNIFNKWPVLVWVGVAVFAWKLNQSGVQFQRMNGVVFAEYEQVSPRRTGTIESLDVSLNQTVTEGQVIAKMDTTLIDQEIEALKEELKLDKMDRQLKYQDNQTKTKLALARAEGEKKAADLEAVNAKAELTRVETSGTASEKLRPNIVRLNAAVTAAETKASEYTDEYMGELRDSVKNAKSLIEELNKHEAESLVSQKLTLLETKKERMTIKAKNAGTISAVYHFAGDIVQDGDPIVSIVTNKKKRVRGLVIDEYVNDVSVGDEVWITPEHKRDDIRTAEIVAVAPTMTAVPDQTSASPNRMVFGREIVCALPDGDKLLGNQRVIIHVEKPGKVDFWSLSTPHRDPNPRD